MHDEGYILHAAQRFLQGEIPYKDFHFIYTPATIFTTVLGIKLFGESILAGRILILIVGVVTSFIVFKTTNQLTNNKRTSLISVLIFLSWGPSHINFPWPVVFVYPLGLITLYLLRENKSFLPLIVAGIIIWTVFLFKQNFGLAVFTSAFIQLFFTSDKPRKKSIFLVVIGMIIAAFLFLIWLVKTDSLASFWKELYEYSIKKIILEAKFTTGFPLGFPKSIVYLFPGFISLIAVGISWLREKSLLGVSLFTLLFYLFGIWPIADYPHLAYLLAATGIPLVALIRLSKTTYLHYILHIVGFILIVSGIYTGLYKNYYRWETPLIRQTHFVSHERVRVFTDGKYKRIIEEITKAVEQYTKKEEPIFVFYRAPLVYFITNRKNPTKYIDFSPDSLSRKEQEKLVADLKKSRVRLIITHDLPSAGNEYIQTFIKTKFRRIRDVYEYGVWVRRDY